MCGGKEYVEASVFQNEQTNQKFSFVPPAVCIPYNCLVFVDFWSFVFFSPRKLPRLSSVSVLFGHG